MCDILSETLKVQHVKSEHERALVECLQKIRQWEKYKADYEKLKDRLKTFPDKLSHETVVKFGNQAFVPGIMVNTNNITVLLGDNWFVEVSAKQAVEIAGRRIKQCENMLSDLNKEKKQFEDWLGFISDVSDHKLVEISEEYNPEKEKLWREQHAERVREHKKQIAREKNLSLSKANDIKDEVKPDEYYFNRLNELEKEEEDDSQENQNAGSKSDEIKVESKHTKAQKDRENKSRTSNLKQEKIQISTEMKNSNITDDKKSLALNTKTCCDSKKESSFETGNDFTKDRYNNEMAELANADECPKTTSEDVMGAGTVLNGDQEKHSSSDKHVRWIDLSEAKSKRITFTHSKPIAVKTNKKNRRRRNSSTSEPTDDESHDDKTPPLINSPSDIYKCFSYSIQHSKPKSILKSMHSTSSTESINGELSDSAINEESECIQDHENDIADDKSSPESPNEKAFTGEVREHSELNSISKLYQKESRPKSLFKASRQGFER